MRGGVESDIPFAVLHLMTALELLLKARVAIKDPLLLVANGKSVTVESFSRGDFRSIGVEDAIELLTGANLLNLTDRQVKQLTTLRSMRNRVTHFVHGAGSIEARTALGAGIHLFIEIHNAEFSDDEVYSRRSMRSLAEDLRQCDEFVRERLDQLSYQLNSSTRPRTRYFSECLYCLQDATVITGENITCLFCGRTATVQDTADLYSNGETVEFCPVCERPSVVCHLNSGDEPTYECICCGYFRGPEIRWCNLLGPITRLREDF